MGEEDAETVVVDFPSSSSTLSSKPRRRDVEGKRRGGRLFGDEDVDVVKDVVKDGDDDCYDEDDANVDEEDANDADEKENHVVVVECDDASEGGDDECDDDATAVRETFTSNESPDDDVPSRNVSETAVETMDAMRRGGCSSPAVSVESATSTETREGKRLSPRLPERLRFGTSLSQLYRLKHGEYVPVGAAGLAILDCKGAKQRDLLVYDPRKRPLVRRKIDERLSIEMQGDNFVTIHHGGSVLWSALMQNESDWLALGAQMLIAQHVAKCRGEIGFDGEPTTLDLASSANVTVELELGDSAQLNYEVVRGGVQGNSMEMNKTRDDDDDDDDDDVNAEDSSDVDHLSYQLYENSSRKVTGVKTKLEVDSTESVLPEQVIHGILGCGKDSRRLILVPKSESKFELYDVTVTRMKKGGRREKSSSAKVERVSGAVEEAVLEEENLPREELAETPRATTSPMRDSPMALHVEEVNARDASTPHAYAGSPPPPWWMYHNQMSVSPMASSTDHHAMIVDVKRAVASLSEDLSFLTSRTRAGGTWIPPKPEGELKRALDELVAARDVVMLPSVAVETLSVGDVKQLTAEARRLSSLQDELRETRAKLQQTREETHLYMERCSRAEEDLEAAQKDVKSLEEQLVREREKVELNKQRAQISAAAESARVAECVLRKEDSMFDADVREVTAPILQENKQLKSVLEDPKWIDEMDELREERDTAMAELDRLQKYVSSLENNATD
jgi:hypothetical protein